MPRRVVLIRAINVGGAKLPMADLREMAAELGATDISTYIASGNLLCTTPGATDTFDRGLEEAITARFGFEREVISRSPEELAAALDAHPFPVLEPRFSYVYCLTGRPDPDKVAAFEERGFGDDVFTVIGSDLHIRYAEGAGTSKLTAPVIAKGLGVQGTGRNLKTIRKLIELAGG
ncbi:DUF1697 domain-containing protein [Gordonia rhizosphera]|uniref:DUF1697 domain-containing protein n=1 Tax=Gordonia rhizosphera NBRC 16068 TaxID=1108045 RepID=K6WQ41_9ACTN|nr:DUF1697 domain-containing protein [Gordonia rhizosphera]GAB88659.1 hypothetical protein GORHZ_034_00250 [Gordonia rhizosphera NBRC 16068]